MTKGIITKTGNSYAIRVPKKYITDNNLQLGDTVTIEEPVTRQQAALKALVGQAKKQGPIAGIADPVAWQRAQRQSNDPWQEIDDDTPRQ